MKKTMWVVLLVSCGRAVAQQDAKPKTTETVVVVGEVEPVTVGESARSSTVIDVPSAPLLSDVEDALRTDASVDIQQRGAAGVMNDISVRGATYEQTLVLVNGFRIDDVETSHFNLDLPVPTGMLRSVNVLHGEGSTLYGSDAVGGVVDFLTLVPTENSLRLRGGYGRYGEDQQGVTATGVWKHASEVVSAERDRSTGFIADRDYRTEDAAGETRVTTRLGTTDVLLAGDDRAFGANLFYGPYNSWERIKGWLVAGSQELGMHTQAAVAYRRHSDIFVLFRDNPAYYKNQHVDSGFQGDVRDRRRVGSHGELLTGFEETTDQIRSTNLGQHGRNAGAGYGVFEWRSPQRWQVTAGVREQVFSSGPVVTSPTFSGTYWLPHAVKLHAAVGHGLRLPTFLDLYYSDPVTNGNPHLRPESGWNYEGGADWFGVQRLTVTTTVFSSHQKDTIDYTRANSASKWTATNIGSLTVNGVETAADWRLDETQRLRVSYTLLHETQGALGGLQSEYVSNYAQNNARVEWTDAVRGEVLVRAALSVLNRSPQDTVLPSAPYAVLDVGAARQRGTVRPYLQISNATNTGYMEIQSVQMPGRSVVGGVEIVLGHAAR